MVHYLISIDINKNDLLANLISKIQKIEGVEIETTIN